MVDDMPDRTAHSMTEEPDHYKTIVEALAEKGYTVDLGYGDTFKVTPPRPPREPDRCGYHDCDLTEQDDFLTEVRVHLAPGEEGDDQMTLYYCNEHLENVQVGLKNLGFTHHVHGGIHFLEDVDCPGAGHGEGPWVCPTPGLGSQRDPDD